MIRHPRRLTSAIAVFLTIASLGSVAACSSTSGGSSSTSGGSSSTKTVTLKMWARGSDSTFMPQLVKSFNASHPKIKIQLTLVPDAQKNEKYALAASSPSSGPDLVATEISDMASYTPTNWYEDITSVVNGLPYRKYLSPAHIRNATYGGKIMGLPLTADVAVLYWNKKLFSEAGLDPNKPPTNWSEIAQDAKKVTALGNGTYGYFFSGACPGCMAFTMMPLVWAQGGDILEGNTPSGTPKFYPNSALESTLSFYRQMWQDGVVAPTAKTENGSNQFGLFFANKIGMFVQGTYPYAILKKEHPNVDFGVAIVPSMDGSSKASFVGGDTISIRRNAPPEAKTALLWFSDEGQREIAKTGVMPARADIAASTYGAQDPRQAVFVNALQFGHTPRSTKTPVLFGNTGPYGEAIQGGVFGSGSVAEAMQKAQSSAEKVFAQ